MHNHEVMLIVNQRNTYWEQLVKIKGVPSCGTKASASHRGAAAEARGNYNFTRRETLHRNMTTAYFKL